MKIVFAVAALVSTLSGCATVTESYSADGRKAYTLNCSGQARGWDKCLAAAGEKCGAKGYDVLDRSGETTSSMAGTKAGIFASTEVERSMLVACKSS